MNKFKMFIQNKRNSLGTNDFFMILKFSISNFNNLEKRQLVRLCLLQSLSNVLDVLGILSVGYLGILSMKAISGNSSTSGLSFLDDPNVVSSLDYSSRITILGAAIMLLLILKTIISLYVTHKIMLFLQDKSKRMTRSFYSDVFGGNYSSVKSLVNEDLHYVISEGVPSVTFGFIAPSLAVISDLFLFLLITATLLYVSPSSTIVFLIFILFMYIVMQKRFSADSEKLSHEANLLRIDAKRKIDNILSSFREQYVGNSLRYSVEGAIEARLKLLDLFSRMEFLPVLNRYLFEIAISVFATLIGIVEFLRTDATEAITTLLMFLLAASRIAPSILRLQQNLIRMRFSKIPIKVFSASLSSIRASNGLSAPSEIIQGTFIPKIELESVSFSYGESEVVLFQDLSLTIEEGTINCITGDSGAGKSTLVDLILGLVQPASGKISISGASPSLAIASWPNQISYVPQKSMIFYDTVRGYLNFGSVLNQFEDEQIIEILKIANIWEKISQLPKSLDSEIGFNGDGFSGGEFQRLAIARALLWKPRLLVLDESTNALDEFLEKDILRGIRDLRSSSTVIIISHNKNLLDIADLIIHVEDHGIKTVRKSEHLDF
jgi:ABC-type bacteriocin/lantibiotic exporter with double-glycine peptidase domain